MLVVGLQTIQVGMYCHFAPVSVDFECRFVEKEGTNFLPSIAKTKIVAIHITSYYSYNATRYDSGRKREGTLCAKWSIGPPMSRCIGAHPMTRTSYASPQ